MSNPNELLGGLEAMIDQIKTENEGAESGGERVKVLETNIKPMVEFCSVLQSNTEVISAAMRRNRGYNVNAGATSFGLDKWRAANGVYELLYELPDVNDPNSLARPVMVRPDGKRIEFSSVEAVDAATDRTPNSKVAELSQSERLQKQMLATDDVGMARGDVRRSLLVTLEGAGYGTFPHTNTGNIEEAMKTASLFFGRATLNSGSTT